MENKNLNEIQDLSANELTSINGGETFWYWVAYGVGQTVRGLEAFAEGAHSTVGQGYPPH